MGLLDSLLQEKRIIELYLRLSSLPRWKRDLAVFLRRCNLARLKRYLTWNLSRSRLRLLQVSYARLGSPGRCLIWLGPGSADCLAFRFLVLCCNLSIANKSLTEKK